MVGNLSCSLLLTSYNSFFSFILSINILFLVSSEISKYNLFFNFYSSFILFLLSSDFMNYSVESDLLNSKVESFESLTSEILIGT
jgi:hypothetical protein